MSHLLVLGLDGCVKLSDLLGREPVELGKVIKN
jgi:hypothetical protein